MKNINKALLIIICVSLFQVFTHSQWVSVNSGTSNFLTGVDVVTTNISYATGFSGTVLKSSNSGVNWVVMTAPSASNINSLSFPPVGTATTGWVASVSGLYKTTNSGTNWALQLSSNFIDVIFGDANTGFALLQATNQPLKRTVNGGTNFNDLTYTTLTGLNGKDIEQGSGTHWYILAVDNADDSSFVFRSTNGGINWGLVFKTGDFQNGLAFLDLNNGIMVGNGGTLRRTTNQGVNWTTINTGLTEHLQSADFINSTTGYIVALGGKILKTTNAGANWFQQTSGTTQTIRGISGTINESVVIACGGNGTMLRTTNGGITFVTQTGNEIPENYSLKQNYPNPFNPQTIIEFSIPEGGLVTLKVYDMLGKEVAKLVNDNLTPGSYATELNASLLPSGTYFYRLTAGEFTETRKMILIK